MYHNSIPGMPLVMVPPMELVMQLVMLARMELVRLLHESVLCICSLGYHKVVAMGVLHREEHDYYADWHAVSDAAANGAQCIHCMTQCFVSAHWTRNSILTKHAVESDYILKF